MCSASAPRWPRSHMPLFVFPFRRPCSGRGHSCQMSGAKGSPRSLPRPQPDLTLAWSRKAGCERPSHTSDRPAGPDKGQEILSHLPWRSLRQPWELSRSLARGSSAVGKLPSQPQPPGLPGVVWGKQGGLSIRRPGFRIFPPWRLCPSPPWASGGGDQGSALGTTLSTLLSCSENRMGSGK